jgi:hypothetical protein
MSQTMCRPGGAATSRPPCSYARSVMAIATPSASAGLRLSHSDYFIMHTCVTASAAHDTLLQQEVPCMKEASFYNKVHSRAHSPQWWQQTPSFPCSCEDNIVLHVCGNVAGPSPHCSVHGLAQGVLPPPARPTTRRRTLQRIRRHPVPQPRQRDRVQQAAAPRPQQERAAGALRPHL